jgi:hypothetical protein
MPLPIVETQTYELTLPSADIKVKYRPFLVREEKILLQAMESQKQNEIVEALKQIVSVCTFNSLNVEDLPTFDLEYIFLNIRAKSVGEIAKLKVLCPDDKETYADVEIDLTKINVQVDDKHNNNIVVDENKKIGLIMKYPTLGVVDTETKFDAKMSSKVLFDIIAKSIYQIYEGDKVHTASDYKKDELLTFIESLDSKTFLKIQEFYDTMPKLMHEIEVLNPKTQVKSKVMLQGLTDFFG